MLTEFFGINSNRLLSRKRKIAALYSVTCYATVDNSKYDNPEYRENERAFLDANDLERSVTTLHTILNTLQQLLRCLKASCG
jgi:hypothetical protein